MSFESGLRFATSMTRNQLSPKKVVVIVSGLIATYTVARVGVLFFEAVAVVREERSQDYELLELCARGDAKSSPKMRDACLKARADMASPLVAKALVYAVSTAFKDFSSSIGSPFKASVLCLFVLSSIVLPMMPWIRLLFGTSASSSSFDSGFGGQPPSHFIVMAPPSGNFASARSKWRRRLGKHLPLLRSKPSIQELEDPFAEEEEEDEAVVHLHQD